MPKVSVIVPNYNHAKYLIKRLESIVNQTFEDFEIILLDDASSDDSVSFLESFAQNEKVTHLVLNEVNSGSPFRQWHRGILLAQGELIWIAESDDWSDIHFLETLIPYFNDPELVLAYCASYTVDENNNILDVIQQSLPNASYWSRDYIVQGNTEISNYLAFRNTIMNASAVIFRKDHYFQSCGVYLDFYFTADWLLWITLLKNKKLCYSANPLNFFRTHEHSTRNYKPMNLEIERLNENLFIIDRLSRENIIKINLKHALKWSWIFTNLVKNQNFTIIEIINALPKMRYPFLVVLLIKLISNFIKSTKFR